MAAFNILEATIDDLHGAYRSGSVTCREVVQAYLDRIEKFDKHGPVINALITVNSEALREAERLDAAYKASGPVGSLHAARLRSAPRTDSASAVNFSSMSRSCMGLSGWPSGLTISHV